LKPKTTFFLLFFEKVEILSFIVLFCTMSTTDDDNDSNQSVVAPDPEPIVVNIIHDPVDTLMDSDSSVATDNGSDIDPNEPIGDTDLEIVGLYANNNGRSCTIHTMCGDHVKVGDVLRLVKTVVTINGHLEDAIKLIKIIDGADACTVAFIPRLQVRLPIVLRNINHFCVVKELYSQSTNSYKRQKLHRNLGMAGVVLLNEIPINE
jgi:hypothetical protein